MILFHETTPESVADILEQGIKQGGSGEKTDNLVSKADSYLDNCIPPDLAAQSVSRSKNIYAYIKDDDSILAIYKGQSGDIQRFIDESDQAVLRIEVDPAKCYVSDLEAYDAVKYSLQGNENGEEIARLAEAYWHTIERLNHFDKQKFKRPEVMITYDIKPGSITVLSKS